MKALAEQISDIDGINIYGRVVGVRGLMVEIAGPIHAMSVGARIVIETGANRFIPCEVIGFTGNNAVVMPFAGLEGVRRGCRAVISNAGNQVRPSPLWLGRVLNAMGEPIDGKGPLPQGASPMPFRNSPPPAHSRKRVGAPLDLGVRAMNTFLTCCRGQRMGIFAGSGVGKSSLLGMIARSTSADVNVICLVGERGREVREFIERDLGNGIERSVVVVATSDQPALVRIKAAFVATAIAEHFRDQGQNVLLIMDSLTRYAMAQREIALAIGEPPATRGYTPSVFALLPLAAAVGAVIAVPFGLVALRVRRHTFIVITIAVFFIFQLMAFNFSFTGGSVGVAAPFLPWSPTTFNDRFYYITLACAVIAHNLLRAAGTLAGGDAAVARGATLRRDLINVPARFAAPARKPMLHLPAHWPRQTGWKTLWDTIIGYSPAIPRAG